MDTHTAVAYKVYEDYKLKTGDSKPALIASTASAYKFAQSVCEAMNINDGGSGFAAIEAVHEKTGVRVPSGLKGLQTKEIIHKDVIDVAQMSKAVYDSVKC